VVPALAGAPLLLLLLNPLCVRPLLLLPATLLQHLHLLPLVLLVVLVAVCHPMLLWLETL
jgi:hypothetical protein